MELIETSWKWMVKGMGAVSHAPFYKLERVVGVDPQIMLMAAAAQEEVGQDNPKASCRTVCYQP